MRSSRPAAAHLSMSLTASRSLRTTPVRSGATDESEAALAAGIPIGRTATTEEVAAVMTFLSGEDASYLTGTTVDVNGGSHIH